MKKTILTPLFQDILRAVDERQLFDKHPAAYAEFLLLAKAMEKAGNRLGGEILIVDVD